MQHEVVGHFERIVIAILLEERDRNDITLQKTPLPNTTAVGELFIESIAGYVYI